MPKIDAFEAHADAYDAWFDEHARLYRAELAAIRALMPSPRGAALEVGVGSGKFATPLGIGVGVEPSMRMAARARGRGVEVYAGAAEALPFAAARFDLLLLVTTICFVDDVARSLRECARVLRPGGRLLVGFVDRASDLGARYLQRRGESKFYGEATFFSAGEVEALLRAAGLRVARIRQTLIPGEAPSRVEEGAGRGGFVVIEALAARA